MAELDFRRKVKKDIKSSLMVNFHLINWCLIVYYFMTLSFSSLLHECCPYGQVISASSRAIRASVWKRNILRKMTSRCLIATFVGYIGNWNLLSFRRGPSYLTILSTFNSIFGAKRAIIICKPIIGNVKTWSNMEIPLICLIYIKHKCENYINEYLLELIISVFIWKTTGNSSVIKLTSLSKWVTGSDGEATGWLVKLGRLVKLTSLARCHLGLDYVKVVCQWNRVCRRKKYCRLRWGTKGILCGQKSALSLSLS